MRQQPAAASREEKPAYHHGDLRAALMSAALSLIDRHGVKGFTLKDAALMAGVSVAAPYRHFADKDALIEAIQIEGFAQFNAALAGSAERTAAPLERIVELGVAYVRFALEHPAHFRVMFGMAGAPKSEPPQIAPTGFHLLLKAVAGLHPGASAEDQRDLVIACWSVVHGYAVLYLDGAFSEMVFIGDPSVQLRRTLRQMMANSAGSKVP